MKPIVFDGTEDQARNIIALAEEKRFEVRCGKCADEMIILVKSRVCC
jgi:hypothetical protein